MGYEAARRIVQQKVVAHEVGLELESVRSLTVQRFVGDIDTQIQSSISIDAYRGSDGIFVIHLPF